MRLHTAHAPVFSLALAAAALTAGCRNADMPTGPDAALPAPSFDKGGTQNHFNEKFEFADVLFPDGTTGTIRAASKLTNNGQDTDCAYFTPTDDYLGQFDTQDFSSSDADTVRQFCLDHYADRTL